MPGAVGSQKTEGQARRALPTYDKSYDYIKSDLGGFGLYYRSVIAELGLIYPGGRGFPYPVDVPSERGREVAAAFRREVEGTTYYRDYFDADEGEVPIDVIREYIRKACLCQLRRPDAADHQHILDTFLHGGGEQQAVSRRATFRLLLDLASQTSGHGLSEARYRQLIYFGRDEDGATFEPSSELEGVAQRWRLYQAREYYSFALNGLWCHLCDWGVAEGGEARPLPVSEIDRHIEAAIDFDALSAELGVEHPGLQAASGWDELTHWLEQLVGADGQAFDRSAGIEAPINEHRLHLLIGEHRGGGVAVTAAVTLLAMLARRLDNEAARFRPEWEISRKGADGRLSVDGFLRSLRRRRAAVDTIVSATRWLYRDYVLLQHELVALSKLPENTFRFRREGSRMRFTAFPNPLQFNSSRFDALTTTLSELGLCGDVREREHALTEEGRALLETGDIRD
jgi:hypothetical protein